MKNNTLSTAVERPVFDGQHPIESGNYHIITKEILDLYGVINKWIKNRLPGGIVYGRPRLGKTRAIEYMRYYLKEEYGKEFPIFSILCSQHKASIISIDGIAKYFDVIIESILSSISSLSFSLYTTASNKFAAKS